MPNLYDVQLRSCRLQGSFEKKKQLKKIAVALVSAVLVSFAASAFASEIRIQSKVDEGPWRTEFAIEPLEGQCVSLRVTKIEGAVIKWFQIQPDTNIRYNNAVWPWLPDAYKWKGFDQIAYKRTRLCRFDGKWEINIVPGENSAESDASDKNSFFTRLKNLFSRAMSKEDAFRIPRQEVYGSRLK